MARKWWIYSTVEPSEDWPGTEFIGPYDDDEARAIIALEPVFDKTTKSEIKSMLSGDDYNTFSTFKWTRIKR